MINISNMIEERSIQYADKSKRKLYKLVLYFFILTSKKKRYRKKKNT